ncbi:carboxylesterase/lipase family protein [Pusillimonas noertemannii]|uniref:carboxylesterase/lipase family protein n=1 Tax=Pusillimonas noertemannii TaxID=305977 RepID=UPI0003076DC1|nr:carboxylesterase family protein [Pusillimonas noertemannii]
MDVQVQLSCGRLQGVRQEGVYQFSGVPYAEDPVGALRFRPPVPKAPWNGVLDATRPSVVAPQAASRLAAVMGEFTGTQDEACLQLTISTPGLDDKKRPVLVWLHGGGFSSGSGGIDWYDGRELARLGDLVVVGVNYRLGALGFLVAEGVSEGNLGLLDQALALEYIRKNVASFGGDPGNLTLMGQSAGGNSIAALFAGKHDVSGVRRVILQSPALGMAPQTARAARASGHEFLKALGLSPDAADLRSQLQKLPVAQILAAQSEVARGGARYGDTTPPFQLSQGEEGAAQQDFHLSAAEALQGVDVLIGITADEAHAFLMQAPRTQIVSAEEVAHCVRDIYGASAVDCLLQIEARHPHEYAGLHFSRLITHAVFAHPTRQFAQRAHQCGSRTYFYIFDWQPEASPFKSCHCLELPFVFGPSDAWAHAPMLGGGDGELLADIARKVQSAWLSFVHAGDPSTDSLPPWQCFTEQTPLVMHLSDSPHMRTEELCLP